MVALINGINNGGTNAQTTQHHSSSDNSEHSVDNASTVGVGKNGDCKRITNPVKQDLDTSGGKVITTVPAQQQQQKTILLKFNQTLMDSDQLIVSSYRNCVHVLWKTAKELENPLQYS